MGGRHLLLAVFLAAPILAGCSTKRYLTVASDPVGARVYIDGEERGVTPLDVPFVHYGIFRVRLEKPGYEAVATDVEVKPGLDGYPVVDLPIELTVRERRFLWTGTLKPVPKTESEEMLRAKLREAEAFRERTRREVQAR